MYLESVIQVGSKIGGSPPYDDSVRSNGVTIKFSRVPGILRPASPEVMQAYEQAGYPVQKNLKTLSENEFIQSGFSKVGRKLEFGKSSIQIIKNNLEDELYDVFTPVIALHPQGTITIDNRGSWDLIDANIIGNIFNCPLADTLLAKAYSQKLSKCLLLAEPAGGTPGNRHR